MFCRKAFIALGKDTWKKKKVTSLIISFLKCKYYPSTKPGAADSSPVTPHINCSIDGTSINTPPPYLCNEGKIAIFLLQETKVWTDNGFSGSLKKPSPEMGVTLRISEFRSSNHRLVWTRTIRSPGVVGKGWGDSSAPLCSLRGNSHGSLLSHLDNAGGTFTQWNVVIKKPKQKRQTKPTKPKWKKTPYLSTECILQLWVFYHAYYKVVTKTVNTCIHEIVTMDQIKPSRVIPRATRLRKSYRYG